MLYCFVLEKSTNVECDLELCLLRELFLAVLHVLGSSLTLLYVVLVG